MPVMCVNEEKRKIDKKDRHFIHLLKDYSIKLAHTGAKNLVFV